MRICSKPLDLATNIVPKEFHCNTHNLFIGGLKKLQAHLQGNEDGHKLDPVPEEEEGGSTHNVR